MSRDKHIEGAGERITIEIVNFENYKGRRDYRLNSWFRMSNRFLEDPDFFDFTFEELIVWIYLLSLASMRNHGVIHVSHQHAHHVARVSKTGLTTAISKLMKIGCIKKPRTRNARGRYERGREKHATIQYSTIQYSTQEIANAISTTEVQKAPTVAAQENLPDFETLKASEQPDELVKAALQPLTKTRWAKLYQDPDFVTREVSKAVGWYLDNPRKAPKSVRGWAQALSSWLERGWSYRAKTTKGETKIESIAAIMAEREGHND